MAKYRTEGIVTDAKIDKDCLTFTISPTPPYSFEDKRNGQTKSFILLVAEPEPDNTVKLSVKIEKACLVAGTRKIGKNETIEVSGVSIENKSGTEILLKGASQDMKRDAKLFSKETKFSFAPCKDVSMTLGAFFVFMQNHSKLTIECNDPTNEPIVATNIEIKN